MLVEMNVWPTVDYKRTKDGLSLDPQGRVRLQELMYGNGSLPAELKAWFNSKEFKQDRANFKARTMERGEQYEEPIYVRKTKEIIQGAHERATQALIAERPDIEEKLRKVGQLRFAQSQGQYAGQATLESQRLQDEQKRLEQLINFGN
jgi:hypothetical protein